MGLRLKFNLAITGALAIGFALAGMALHDLFLANARQQVIQNARIMIEAGNAVRHYTDTEIGPLIGVEQGNRFLKASVPFFAAQAVFRDVHARFPDFVYKEAALNPTNLTDRATDWEADIINGFRNAPTLAESISERETPTGRSLNLARPIAVNDQQCLACHSVPSAAPASMLAAYGTSNGFGWQMNEIIGAQIVSVPEAVPLAEAHQAFTTIIGILAATFVLITVLLNLLLQFMVTKPVVTMAAIANDVSLGKTDVEEYERAGSDEIASLAQSFNRMRRSLDSALRLLEARG
jgi:protein-histidine pros-kinase